MAVEPLLKISRPPARPALAPVLALFLAGLAVLVLTPVVIRPTPPAPVLVEIRGKMASKVDYFDDGVVRDILRRNGFALTIDNVGSREVARHDLDRYDFVFPSGQPATEQILTSRQNSGKPAHASIPFVSPIVLATYRPYALALRDAGIARPMNGGRENPLYYEIDIGRFVELTEQGRRWNDLGIGAHGIQNNNRVLAHTADVCQSNSGGTYQGLIAYAKNNSTIPEDEAGVAALAERLKPLYRAQGALTPDRVPYYLSPEGKRIAPIVVIYEHQYLAHQLRRPPGQPDDDRVLLYPADHFETQPSFIGLNDHGRKLGQLLETDPGLRARAVELGFRVLESDTTNTSPQLNRLLGDHRLETPSQDNDHSRAYLPQLDLFEQLITQIGNCP